MNFNLGLFHLIILLLTFSTIANCQKQITNGSYYERIGGLQLHYTIRGKGPVMIAGHVSSGKIGYELTLKPLEEYFTMVYYEPRGTGKSEVPGTIEEYGQDYMVREIEDIRRHLDVDKIWIFGHSDQSAIALVYALKYAQHTSGLILTGTGWVGTQQETYDRRKQSETKRAEESAWFAQVIKDWDYMMAHHTTTDEAGKDISESPIKWWCYDEATAQKVIPVVRETSKAGRRKPVNNIYAIETEAERQKYLDDQKSFPDIKTEILIINGKYDINNPPECAAQLQAILPNSRLVFIDQAGHFPWIENPEATFREIENWVKK